ncbi:1,4-alpha-glucan branching protein [Anaerococcus obesiensis]|uniref:1,4-alpha-glucan branching protein n=1 Tax=Anaerococcus obesiensis TaxID=1287640 RepID=A0A7T7UTS3_9FIRM|nr:1,4-alpha-glucan-branching protein [Anaerococcus obesiensis]QQN55949.1 1,4-alpha-glucan branching protein [Anaerococcus obesiensis]
MDTRKYLEGKGYDGYKFFGNHKKANNSYIFRILAPNAKNVYIIGDFNSWTEEKLRKYSTGVFSKTIKNVKEFDKYLYVIENENGKKFYKLDPYAKLIDKENENSIVYDKSYKFSYKYKNKNNLNIYQMSAKNFDRKIFEDEKYMDKFIRYLKENNFFHVDFMPIFANRFKEDFSYGSSFYFSINENCIEIEKIKLFIDLCHKNKLGIIFEIDISSFAPFGKYLNKFDGSNMYNYDYDDILYNYSGLINIDPTKNLAKSFILSFVTYLIKEFNIDAIAIANLENLIFWQGDKSRGYNENWLGFIRNINEYINDLNKISIGFYNSIWKNDIKEDLGFDLIYDRTFAKIIKINQKNPFERANYSYIVKNIIENDYKNYLLGFNYFDSLSEGASLAMKMNSNDKKYDQLKTLFLLVYTLNSNKMIFSSDEFGSLETFNFDKKINIFKQNESEKDFNEFYKKLSDFYIRNKNLYENESKTKILEIEGYSLYAFKRIYKNEEYLIIVNLTDLEYKIDLPEKIEKILTSYNENYHSKNKLYIPAFGSGIFKIK